MSAGADRAGVGSGLAQPVEQATPVRRAHQHDREPGHLVRLHQRQRLEQLVERAEAAGQHDEALRRTSRTSSCGAKKYRKLTPRSTYSFMPCSNGSSMPSPTEAPPASHAPLLAASIAPGPAAGDDGVARLDQRRADLSADARSRGRPAWTRAEPKTLTAGPSSASAPKPSTNSLWIRMHAPRVACAASRSSPRPVEQPLVGGGRAGSAGRAAGPGPCGTRGRCGHAVVAHGSDSRSTAAVRGRRSPRVTSGGQPAAQRRVRHGRSARRRTARRPCGPAAGRPARSSRPGRPSAENRATSVQPYLAAGRAARRPRRTPAAAGGSQPGPRAGRRVDDRDVVPVEQLAHVVRAACRRLARARSGS